MYGCTEAFLADAKWILHNCIIYNGGKNMLVSLKLKDLLIYNGHMNVVHSFKKE